MKYRIYNNKNNLIIMHDNKMNKHGKLRISRIYELDSWIKKMIKDEIEFAQIEHMINYNNTFIFEEREYLSLRFKDYTPVVPEI